MDQSKLDFIDKIESNVDPLLRPIDISFSATLRLILFSSFDIYV